MSMLPKYAPVDAFKKFSTLLSCDTEMLLAADFDGSCKFVYLRSKLKMFEKYTTQRLKPCSCAGNVPLLKLPNSWSSLIVPLLTFTSLKLLPFTAGGCTLTSVVGWKVKPNFKLSHGTVTFKLL